MANYRIPGPLDASRGNRRLRDGTGPRAPGVIPGAINGADAGHTSVWDDFIRNLARAEAVRDAVRIGQRRAGAAILRETGHALEALVKGLIPGLLMMMVVLVATTVIGGVIGAVIGFFAGGVGAAPGAVVGADLGASAGMAILTWLGLGFLAIGIAEGFGELVGHLAHATTRAWNAPDSPRERAEIDAAGEEYATAVALLFKLILMAIVARLTMGQAKASTQETLTLLRKSRLGQGFADWVAANQEALLANPRLRPRPKVRQTEAPAPKAQTPSQVKNAQGAKEPSPPKATPKLRYPVETKPDEAFFWSGRTGDVGGEAVARQIAESKNGTTLEALIEKRGIEMPKWDPTDPKVVQAWKDISADYAAGASGTVRGVIGESLRPGNVWQTAELPALMNNPNVTKIITIDPATLVEKVIFTR